MVFTLENGQGIANANAYIDVAFADSYFLDRNITTWTGIDRIKQAAIIKATDYIEIRYGGLFLGDRQYASRQGLSFPRVNLCDRNGRVVRGIPNNLKQATAEYALRALTKILLADPEDQRAGPVIKTKREKIGPIEEETEYLPTDVVILQAYPSADYLLREYILNGNSVIR